LNGELLLSPRAQLLYKPLGGKQDVSWTGWPAACIMQPPFYREMRGFDGLVNTQLRAQKSAHIVGGMTYDFYMGKRNPTKFKPHYRAVLQEFVGYGVVRN
jgi:hypothetical protein